MIGKRVMLTNYMQLGIFPILLENVSFKNLKNTIMIDAKSEINSLNGFYENDKFSPPIWYQKLINIKDSRPILLIKNLNLINTNEQMKFLEILKYKKINTFELPKNCLILVTCKDLDKNAINENIYSLLVHI